MQRLKIAVVGVGYLGSRHARVLSGIKRANLIGVYDIKPERAESIARELNIKAFKSLDETLTSVEALTIATPTTTHFEIAVKALESGKHVFIEKPITEKIEDADKIIELSKLKNLKIQVGHIERFNPALLSLKNYRLNPVFIEVHRLAQFKPRGTDVAVILDLMIHDIDIILTLVKSPIQQIRANGVAVVSDSIDIANARIEFSNGCVANVTASRISRRKERKMRIFQKDAYILIDFLQGLSEVFRLVDKDSDEDVPVELGNVNWLGGNKKILYEQPEVEDVNPLEYELKLFVDSVLDDLTPPVTADEARKALEVSHRIIREIEKHQNIVKKEILGKQNSK